MPIVVSFTDYVPPPRFDGIHWTLILIGEAASEAGPFTQIDTITLNPVDADPTQPQARAFTTQLATLVEGWYQITWKDAAGHTIPTDPVHNVEMSDINYQCTVSQVARKTMARTRDTFGNLLGTFTAATTPNATQVANIIQDVMPSVADCLGDQVPDPLIDDAQQCVALLAACQIELDFFPDQVNTNRSIYPQLMEQYKALIASVEKQVAMFGEGETAVTTTGPTNSPSYSFPDAPDPGWLTRRM